MEKKEFSYFKLFISMMSISAFTFGGGFVIIGMMQKRFCDEYHWVSKEDVLDMTAIAQSAPGALAVNSAVIFGYRIAGVKAALVSTLATVIPPIFIISVITLIYDTFSTNQTVQIALQVMRAGVAAIITDVVIDLAKGIVEKKDMINVVLMILAFIASWYFKVSSISIILFFICLGILFYFINKRKENV